MVPDAFSLPGEAALHQALKVQVANGSIARLRGFYHSSLRQQSHETIRDGIRIRQLTFPHCDDPPAEPAQLSLILLVTSHGTIDLVAPKFGSGVRIICVSALCMVMPEAPVNEDNGFEPPEGYVGFARKAAHVDPKPEA